MIGSDNSPNENDSYIGEQLIAIAKTSSIPVYIIPCCVTYEKIEKALVPCDFDAISRLSALQGFRDPKKWLHPELMILNVDPKQKHPVNNEQPAAGLVDIVLQAIRHDVWRTGDDVNVEREPADGLDDAVRGAK